MLSWSFILVRQTINKHTAKLKYIIEEALNWVSAIRSEGGGWGWGAGCNLNKMPRVRFTERVIFEQDWN